MIKDANWSDRGAEINETKCSLYESKDLGVTYIKTKVYDDLKEAQKDFALRLYNQNFALNRWYIEDGDKKVIGYCEIFSALIANIKSVSKETNETVEFATDDKFLSKLMVDIGLDVEIITVERLVEGKLKAKELRIPEIAGPELKKHLKDMSH